MLATCGCACLTQKLKNPQKTKKQKTARIKEKKQNKREEHKKANCRSLSSVETLLLLLLLLLLVLLLLLLIIKILQPVIHCCRATTNCQGKPIKILSFLHISSTFFSIFPEPNSVDFWVGAIMYLLPGVSNCLSASRILFLMPQQPMVQLLSVLPTFFGLLWQDLDILLPSNLPLLLAQTRLWCCHLKVKYLF